MKKIITLILSLLMICTIAMPVFAENEYTVTIDYNKGLIITANEGGDLNSITHVILGGTKAPFAQESDFTRTDNSIIVSKLAIKKMIDKEATVSENGYNVQLYKSNEGGQLDMLYSTYLQIDSNQLISNIDPNKISFATTTEDNGRVWHNITITDEFILANNPYSLKVYYGENLVYYSYSQDSHTYKVDDYLLNSSVPYGTYTPVLKIEGYNDYSLAEVTIGYKPCNFTAEYDSASGEIVIDLSAYDDEEKNLIADIMLSTREEYSEKYSDLGFYAFSINAITVQNDVKYGDDQPVYKKDANTLAVKAWMIDVAKKSEEEKDRNQAYIQLPGYMMYSTDNFTVESESLPEGFSAKIAYEKDGVYLDVECVNSDLLSKIYMLQYYAVPLVYMEGGVGVAEERPASMEARGVLTYPTDHSFRVKLNSNSDKRFNGAQGFEIKITGLYGEKLGDIVRTVVAPNVGMVDSEATTLSDITLVDGWPNVSVSKMATSTDVWHWVNPSESVSAGTTSEHYAQIEVWDYTGSPDLSNNSQGVDYGVLCSKLSNVEYIVTEDGHHYLRAKVTVSVPVSVGNGIKTSINNFNPNDDTSSSVRQDINKIQSKAEENNATEVAYYDIKLNDGATTSLDNEAQIKVALPQWIVNEPVEEGKDRVYTVITVHNGEIRTLPATYNGDGTLSFGSDKFSVFTVTYADVIKTNTETGNGNEGGSSSEPVTNTSSESTNVSRPAHKPVVNTAAK